MQYRISVPYGNRQGEEEEKKEDMVIEGQMEIGDITEECRFVCKKMILDVTCGGRSIWFQKEEPHTIYCDRRSESFNGVFGSNHSNHTIVVKPDVVCDFTDLPFENDTFNLVVFDPPHIENLKETSWFKKRYGSLDGDWKPMLRKGFSECMRVLQVGGVLIFKWSEVKISTREIIDIIGQEPLFGHRSGKKMNTHWMCFMKF